MAHVSRALCYGGLFGALGIVGGGGGGSWAR